MTEDIHGEIAKRMGLAFDSAFTDALDLPPVDPDAPPLVFKKNAIAMRIDERLMPGWSPDQLPPDERAKYDAEMREFRLERNRQAMIREAAWASLRGITEPAIRAVLDLHAMVDSRYGCDECAHCYRDTEMGDHEDWPCDTVRAVAKVYGIEVPK